jgi:hypothetical protein
MYIHNLVITANVSILEGIRHRLRHPKSV